METENIILLANLWCLIAFWCFSGEPVAKLPAGCRKLNNFCNALVRIARTLPLAAKSCELFSSSAAKDFFTVTLRQPYSKLAAGFSFSKGAPLHVS